MKMKKILEKGNDILKFLVFIASLVLIFISIPKEAKFKFEFSENEIWKHPDLYAPFSFPIQKSKQQIESEKNEIINNFKPYYFYQSHIHKEILKKVESPAFRSLLEDNATYNPNELILAKGKLYLLVKEVYSKGVIDKLPDDTDKTKDISILIIREQKESEEFNINDLYTIKSAKEFIRDYMIQDSTLFKLLNLQKVISLVEADIILNKELSEKTINARFDEIIPINGMVQAGEKIISRGVVVNKERFQILESLRNEYESIEAKKGIFNLRHLGYMLILIIIIGGFGFYLWEFYKGIYFSLKNIFMIYLLITTFILISAYLVKSTTLSIYLIPFCIVPIVLLSFYEARIAFIGHLIVISTVSLFAPNSYEFLIIQIIAGLTIVISITKVRYISQFFISTLILLIVYFLTNSALLLIRLTEFDHIQYMSYLWFAGSFILTLLAYPLIYAFEKLFGYISDITLIELSDINKKLLKDLSSKAQGTFQHSLQVANLSESVLLKIGGNALLAKVGALYHDIGKMNNPLFFTENQKDFNPHDKLTEKESAEIIMRHVSDGVKLAKENRLPKEIIEFIKTHHGKTRVEYFYRNFIKQHPEETSKENEFRYPGPKPMSKETAVVMIADSVEAAARSLKETSPETIERVVDSLVDGKIKDNQFKNANITLKELSIAKEILKNRLKSIYHSRIEYPSEN